MGQLEEELLAEQAGRVQALSFESHWQRPMGHVVASKYWHGRSTHVCVVLQRQPGATVQLAAFIQVLQGALPQAPVEVTWQRGLGQAVAVTNDEHGGVVQLFLDASQKQAELVQRVATVIISHVWAAHLPLELT